MPRIAIEDLDDPRLAVYRHLKRTNETRGLPRFVVEGDKLVARLAASRFPVESVVVSERRTTSLPASLSEEIPVYVLPHERLDELVGFNFHQGSLACGVRGDWPSPEEWFRDRRGVTLVVCPEIHNPENLGSIVRIADVFGVDGILVGPSCPDPFSRRILRVSMGTVLNVAIFGVADVPTELNRLRVSHGLRMAACVASTDAIPVSLYRRPERLAVVLGHEAHGVPAAIEAVCDDRITIPMRPGAGSLNVAVAAGIVLYALADPTRHAR